MLQASCRFSPLMLLFSKDDSGRDMSEMFVLEDTEETHGRNGLS